MKKMFPLFFLLFAGQAFAEGVQCVSDLRSEGGPYEEVKLVKVGGTFKLNVKQTQPGSTAAPTEKTLVDGLSCQFASEDARIAFCSKPPRRRNEEPTDVLLRKVEVTELTSLENRSSSKQTFLEVEVLAPDLGEGQGHYNFLLNECKKI